MSDGQNKPKLSTYTYDSTVEQCYFNLPKDMVEDNPLDLENIKERRDHDEKLMQSTVKYPEWYTCKSTNNVDDILFTLNQVIIQPTGKLHYLRM
jgi:hypothetical protein